MTNKATTKGIIFLFTMAIVETFAISAVAIMTPAIGETVLPIDADSCIGKIIEVLSTPNVFAIFGTKGPNAKNDAFPLPISMDARKIIIVITTPIPMAPKPKLCAKSRRPFINPRLIRPLAKISAVIIKVTTVLKIFPMPFQKIVKDSKTTFMFLVLINSKIRATNKLINIAVVVSSEIGVLKKLNILENTIKSTIGNIGINA